MPARRHLERDDPAGVVVVVDGVDHPQRATEVAELDVAAIRAALLREGDRCAGIDRRDGDRSGAGIDELRGAPVRPHLNHAAPRGDLEVLSAAALGDDRVRGALVENAHPARGREVRDRSVEVRVVPADEAALRRRRREQHAVERARWVDELQRRARVVLGDDLLAGERDTGRAGGPSVRPVLAHAQPVTEP